jgi:hypothetical protein
MKGALFWKAFLFKTPFALLRLLPALMVVFYGISFYKAYQKYSRPEKFQEDYLEQI